jgi:hypothetical protein
VLGAKPEGNPCTQCATVKPKEAFLDFMMG